MSYGLVDDRFHCHRKPAKAGAEAIGLWTLALSWCKDTRSEGFVPVDRPLALLEDEDDPQACAERCIARLVKARLWEPVEGGWQFHDWADHQNSAEEDDARKAARHEALYEARAEAGRRGGLAKASNAKQRQATDSNSRQEVANVAPSPSPSPSPTDPSGGGADPPGPALPPADPIPKPPTRRPARSPEQAPLTLEASGPKPETPLEVAWRTWRDEYRTRYGQGYSSSGARGPDGKAMQAASAAALEQLAADQRSPEDLERLHRHRWRAYLADAGSKDFSLRDRKHGLQWFAYGTPAYGTPWDRVARPERTPPHAEPPPPARRVLDRSKPPPGVLGVMAAIGDAGTGRTT